MAVVSGIVMLRTLNPKLMLSAAKGHVGSSKLGSILGLFFYKGYYIGDLNSGPNLENHPCIESAAARPKLIPKVFSRIVRVL